MAVRAPRGHARGPLVWKYCWLSADQLDLGQQSSQSFESVIKP
jgi:hypothetical protein